MFCGVLGCGSVSAAEKIPAPEFADHLDWLNVDKPLTLKELRGKVVVLDFWCYCCINCMHIIPDLHRLEDKYGPALEIIGVHSAKYVAEHATDNIRDAILRYGITHPVVNDRNFDIWNSYGAHAWPSLVLIDADGNVAAAMSGEGVYDAFDQKIGDLIHSAEAGGTINRTPIALHLEKDKAPPTALSFPGKIAAADGKLFISDSGHNRIVVINLADNTIDQTIGDGNAGLKDGSFALAEFSRPQGVAVDGKMLYVADTENHAIRAVDLAAKTVRTLARQGGISSPWDVLVHDGALYIALAGSHQLGRLDLGGKKIAVFAGSGREQITDGPLAQAAFAQPSGLATDGSVLFSADSETSSIRAVNFDPAGRVRTVVGSGLFDFGDADGERGAVRLQHALGVCYHEGRLYVADTYNNKIKAINPVNGETHTIIGSGIAGFTDGPALLARLNEPAGLTFAGGKLYIADTDNHLIRVFDPATGTVNTLMITDAEKLLPSEATAPPEKYTGTVITLPAQSVAAGAVKVAFDVTVPPQFKLNAAAPFYFGVSTEDGKTLAASNVMDPKFPVTIPIKLAAGTSRLTIDLVIYYCDADQESFCRVKRLRYLMPVEAGSGSGGDTIEIRASP